MSEAIEIGQILKGYELKEVLGKGGFGAVYRAYQPLVKREVAMKVILPAFANRPSFVRRFETEAQLVAQLEHLYIVPLYDYWRDPSGAYLVMRMLRGGTLEHDLKKSGAWSVQMTAQLLDQMSAALNVAHQTGVVHSDLKPANILLDLEKNGFLSDFGIASNLREEGHNFDDSLVAVGTPAYITPEQIQNQPLSPQSDIYSLGLVVFETLTGKRAFQAQNIYGYVSQQLTKDLPDVTEFNPDVPAAVNEVLAVATAKNPASRYPDAPSFARAFRQAIRRRQEFNITADDLSESDDLIKIEGDIGRLTITPELVELEAHNLALVNPYKGLRAFQQGDAKDFFGREQFTESVLNRLRETTGTYRFLAIIGPSGSGKSSVIKAGVLPALRRGAVPGSEHYFLAEMVPSTDALRELEAALLSIATAPPENMSERLRGDKTALHQLLNQILPNDGSEFLLLIDQFEEVFTQTNDNAVRVHFLESIRHAVTAPDSRLRVIITLRADFYDKPLSYPDFGALVRERTEVILPMNERELEQAIKGPAERLGVRVEPALVKRMVEDVSSEPGALPLLQYALTENFERRTGYVMTLEAYLAAGGVLGALARRAEELYGTMDDEQKEAVRQLFLRLVTLGEGAEDTRRRVLWSELVFTRDIDDPLQFVLDTYGKYRLLTFDTDPQTREPTVEVAHEALIRNWERLRGWLRDSREDLRVQRRLAGAVMEWRNSSRDASFLASGVRLQQFEQLSTSKDISLTPDEKAYIQASTEKREALAREEEARLAREAALKERNRQILRALVVVFAVATVVALVLAVIAFTGQQEAATQRDRAAAEAVRANQEADRAEREAAESHSIVLAQQAETTPRDGDQPLAGIALAMEANRLDNAPIQAQRTLADTVLQPGALRQFRGGHSAPVFRTAVTPDGTQLLSGGMDGLLILWDVATGREVRRFGEDGAGAGNTLFVVAISPDGTTALSGSQQQQLILWDMATGQQIRRIGNNRDGHVDAIWGIAYLPDGQSAIVSSNDADQTRNLIQWDLNTGEIIRRFASHDSAVYGVALSPDGETFVSTGADGVPRLWDIATGEIIRRYEGHTKAVFSAAFSPDGTRLFGGGEDTFVTMWDVATGDIAAQYDGFTALVRGVAYSPDGNTVAAASFDSTVRLFDAQTLAPLSTFQGHALPAVGVTYTPDGTRVISSAVDPMILWDVYGRGAEVWRAEQDGRVYSVAASQDRLAVTTADGISVLDAATGAEQTLLATAARQNAVAVSGDLIVSGGADGMVTLWDAAAGEVVAQMQTHSAPIRTVALSPDGNTILSAGGSVQINHERVIDNEIALWTTETDEIRRLSGHTAPVRSAVFSADGTRILSGSDDGSMILWDAATGETLRVFPPDNPDTDAVEGHSDSLTSVALSADGTRALSASRDRTALLWDVATGRIIHRLLGSAAVLYNALLSPDGQYALTAGGNLRAAGAAVDNTLTLYDLATGEPVRRYHGHDLLVRALAFAPDGMRAYSGGDDGRVIAWRIDTPQAFTDWVYANYQVDCVPAEIGFNDRLGVNPRCQPLPVTEAASPGATASFEPAQTENIDGVTCSVPTPADYAISATAVDTAAFETDAPYTIGYSQASDDARSQNIAAWARYEASLHDEIETFTVLNAGGSPAQQVGDIQALIGQGVDLLIVEPLERTDMSNLQAALTNAGEAGIPVVLVSVIVPDADFAAYVGVNDFEVGCIMAQELVAALDGEGVYLRLNGIDATYSDNARKAGALALFGLYPGLQQLDEVATGLNPLEAQRITRNALNANSQLDGVWGYNGAVTAAALQTILDAGHPPVAVIGDQAAALAVLMLDNEIGSSLLFIPSSMGADAVRVGVSILQGADVESYLPVALSLIEPTAEDAGQDGLLRDLDGVPDEFRP
jgi:WD40 repeat protein/serine/threonine protein kinase/ABC-type sugar transport system substrate-binding protein